MAHINPQLVEERINRFGKLYLIDDIIRRRAQDEEQVPILGYPKYEDNAAEYEFFTGKDLDRMVDACCRALIREGFKVNEGKTIGLFAPSDLSFVITFFALFRLGYKVLTISIRLGAPACLVLLERAECDTVLHGSTRHITSTLAEVAAARPDTLTLRPMLPRSAFDDPSAPPQPPFERPIADREAEHTRVTLMMHSSGSTGLPKPLLLSHRSLLSTLVSGTGLKAFNALPWYHLHGLITSVQAMWMRRTTHLFNPHLPLTANNLIAAMETIQPEIAHCVPYGLKLIAEQPRGVELLKKCKAVTSAGAPTPDELGDRMIKEGVKLGVLFGLTEVGHVGDSVLRQPGDDAWDYIRPYANVLPHMIFKPVGLGNIHESVYLSSHPALMVSNCDHPPRSYRSGDLFTPHPTIPNAWKFVARNDDRITLLSGEKILPLAMEGCVRESPLARDALMVGNDRLVPGMLVFRAAVADGLSDEEYVRAIWPDVERANAIADEFARLTPDMIMPVPSDVDYPATDKKNIIRAQCYRVFADRINCLYRRQLLGDKEDRKQLALDLPGLEKFIMEVVRDQAGIAMPDPQADFFASGIDSLRAAQIRRLLMSNLDIGGNDLPTNVVYDCGNVQKLARRLYELRTGHPLTNGSDTAQEGSEDDGQIAVMDKLISKYGSFKPSTPGSQELPVEETVILTGATGALGAHLLHQLLRSPRVRAVYALVRGADPQARITASLLERGLPVLRKDESAKLTVLSTPDLGAPKLGLTDAVFDTLQSTTTLILHAAWPVNFNLPLSAFAPHLAGLHNLLALSLAVPFAQPARLLFASSISTAFALPGLSSASTTSSSSSSSSSPSSAPIALPATTTVPEASLPDLRAAAATGYARSKLVGERICERAAAAGAGAPHSVAVLRIGQIAGDTDRGIWNVREAVPLMVQSAGVVGALPLLDSGRGGVCAWIPVDVVARCCLELAAAVGRSGGVGRENGSVGVNSGGVNGSVNGTNGVNGVNGSGDHHHATNGVNGHADQPHTASGTTHTLGTTAYYNILPPRTFSWNDTALPALKAAGLTFDVVPLAEWVARLRAKGKELGHEAEARLPALKLADYFEATYGEAPTAIGEGLVWETSQTYTDSPALAGCPDVVEGGLVGKFVKSWREVWGQ